MVLMTAPPPPRPAALSPHQYSLVAWLALQGVFVETGNGPAPFATAQEPTDLHIPKSAPPAKASVEKHFIQNITKTYETIDALYADMAAAGFGLARTATNLVRGVGQTQSPALMIIGEAPESEDDLSARAFDSVAGRMILTAAHYAGFDMSRCYATHLSKWRTPGQRTLYAAEVTQFSHYIMEEIRLVNPKAILLLGDTVSRLFLSDSGSGKLTLGKKTNIEIQSLGKSLPILTSQKGEFLVKNKGMKKSFWFSLVDLAETTRS